MNKLFVFYFLLLISTISYSQVLINEFLTDNLSVYPDMVDYDDYSDWIELYNNQSILVDLTGYYLTDNLNNPLKWEIPHGTIMVPHGYLIIRADGFDAGPRKISSREFWPWDQFTTKGYHANFKLSSLGEEIGLFKAGASQQINLIPTGSEWKYADDGVDRGYSWKEADYNDDGWKTGMAQFGYGDGDENTVVSFGSDPNNKFITTYFRKKNFYCKNYRTKICYNKSTKR